MQAIVPLVLYGLACARADTDSSAAPPGSAQQHTQLQYSIATSRNLVATDTTGFSNIDFAQPVQTGEQTPHPYYTYYCNSTDVYRGTTYCTGAGNAESWTYGVYSGLSTATGSGFTNTNPSYAPPAGYNQVAFLQMCRPNANCLSQEAWWPAGQFNVSVYAKRRNTNIDLQQYTIVMRVFNRTNNSILGSAVLAPDTTAYTQYTTPYFSVLIGGSLQIQFVRNTNDTITDIDIDQTIFITGVSIKPAPSPSPSFTSSVSPSNTKTVSGTSSTSRTASKTGSGTVTPSRSITSSGSETATATSSQVSTHSITTSRTVTNTASATPSPGSFSLSLLTEGYSNSGTLLLSDGRPWVVLRLNAANCASKCVVKCSSSSVSVQIAPSTITFTGGTGTPLSVWAPFGRTQQPTDASITCTSDLTSAVISLHVMPTRWPLFDDALVMLADGTARSAWSSRRFNMSALVLEQQDMSYVSDQTTNNTAPFSVVVTDGAEVQLLAYRDLPLPPFAPNTQVFANDAPCTNVTTDSNGRMLRFTLPRRQALCPNILDEFLDCGYVHLTLVSQSDGNALGTNLSCPPFCPHDMPGTIPVAVETVDGIRVTPGILGGDDSVAPPVPLHLATLPSTGFYVTQACSAAGYLDPSDVACLNSSDSRHTQCAFGAGASCQPCPPGALCPGGYRAWPLSGYYTAVEASGNVVPCPPPASLRCLGWNVTIAAVQCASEYAQSHLCAACAPSFYITLDGTSASCPSSHVTLVDILQPIAVFAAGLLGACGLLYLCLVVIVRIRGFPIGDLPMQMLQLIAWAFVIVQVVSQVGQAAVPGLPATVLRVYEQLAVFQFQGAALPSGCIPGFPFTNEVTAMSLALGLLLATIACGYVIVKRPVAIQTPILSVLPLHQQWMSAGVANLFYSCVMGLFVMYATVTNTIVSLLFCTELSVSALAYNRLMGYNDISGAAALLQPLSTRYRAPVTVSLLHSNPSIVCYVGPHLLAGSLAWVTLLAYCIAFPLLSLCLVYWRMSRMLVQLEAATTRRSRASVKIATRLCCPTHLREGGHHGCAAFVFRPSRLPS
jgi:hypothetical protein